MSIEHDRLQLGGAAVLSPSKAAELLPVRDADGVRWLREHGLVRHIAGLGEVVVWGDVLDLIRAGGAVASERPRSQRPGGYERAGLVGRG